MKCNNRDFYVDVLSHEVTVVVVKRSFSYLLIFRPKLHFFIFIQEILKYQSRIAINKLIIQIRARSKWRYQIIWMQFPKRTLNVYIWKIGIFKGQRILRRSILKTYRFLHLLMFLIIAVNLATIQLIIYHHFFNRTGSTNIGILKKIQSKSITDLFTLAFVILGTLLIKI